MANNIAFQAQGKTYKANVTTSSQTITITADSPCNQLCVANHQPTGSGGQPVYFQVSNLANVTCTAPASGAPSYALVSVPGTIKVLLFPSRFLLETCISLSLVRVHLSATSHPERGCK